MVRVLRWPAVGLLAPALLLVAPTAAWGADGEIDQVTTDDGRVQVLFSLRDLPPDVQADLDSVETTIDGDVQPAEAKLASEATTVDRVTLLTIDVSASMSGERFEQAKTAALAFVDQAPDDVQVGLVTFASTTAVVEEPTVDRDAMRTAIEDLTLSRRTELYDGIRTAIEALPADAQSSLLVLTDGRDTSGEALGATLETIRTSEARVDVVALEQRGPALATLDDIATEGGGEVISTDDPSALTALFEAQAEVLASQVVVSLDVPQGWTGGDATVDVTLTAGRRSFTDNAFVTIPALEPPDPEPGRVTADEPLPVDQPLLSVTRDMMIGGLVALAIGGALLVLSMTGVLHGARRATVTDRLAPYDAGARKHAFATKAHVPGPSSVVKGAVGATEKVLRGRSLEIKLARKLDAGGMKLHAAEWLLLHAGITVGSGLLGYALSGGILMAVVLLIAGAVVPYVYLWRKESTRIKAFGSQLAPTLQLIAGSLSAGLSLAQSLDTVVREGEEPVAGEFRRALVEQRLGVHVEEALEGVAQRMRSDDFAWVVMAIRIQRDVGGNLSELLLTVAATLREREYLRRQVRTLSAEGRLSAWILGGLPPAFFVYLMLVSPDYLDPMVETTLGWLMLGGATVMMALGTLMLKKMVKVEV